ncbi:GNAT family N-acetyltransferase [Terrabacter terrae]|uniref:GNAT family N-acetyltransferase n=1 Tax=Terrabacter terrae TaxID=318434 RepID=A0ABN2UMA5_9MICO
MTEQTGEHTGQSDGEGATDSTDSPDSVQVVDNPEQGRFELRDGDDVIGVAAYAVVPGGGADQPERVVFFHTEVRPEYEGQGLAGRLASHALDRTVESGRSIVALCPYIKEYVERHPEPYAAHLQKPTRADVEAAKRASAG